VVAIVLNSSSATQMPVSVYFEHVILHYSHFMIKKKCVRHNVIDQPFNSRSNRRSRCVWYSKYEVFYYQCHWILVHILSYNWSFRFNCSHEALRLYRMFGIYSRIKRGLHWNSGQTQFSTIYSYDESTYIFGSAVCICWCRGWGISHFEKT
jgi:hypothetical protein